MKGNENRAKKKDPRITALLSDNQYSRDLRDFGKAPTTTNTIPRFGSLFHPINKSGEQGISASPEEPTPRR